MHALCSLNNKTLFLFAVFLYLQGFNELNSGFRKHWLKLSTSKIRYFLLILALPLLLSGCIGTRHLKENERLLLFQRINAPNHINKEDLRGLYAQRENRKILGVVAPLIEIYYWGERNYEP